MDSYRKEKKLISYFS